MSQNAIVPAVHSESFRLFPSLAGPLLPFEIRKQKIEKELSPITHVISSDLFTGFCFFDTATTSYYYPPSQKK